MTFRCGLILVVAFLQSFSLTVRAQSSSPEPLIVRPDETVSDIVVRGRELQVLGQVNGSILALGSNAIIEGRVQGDATAIGGSIIQRNGGFIGGDVIVVGGDYQQSPDALPLNSEAQKVVVPEYGEYFRETFQHPWRRLFLPEVTPLYIGQRVLGLLFYFLIALLLIALVPTQLNRAIEVLKQRYRNIVLIGLVGALLLLVGLILLVRSVPIEVAGSIMLFALLILLGTYFFGSLTIYLLVGRWLQKRLRRGSERSNINALLYALIAFAIVFSIPVIGMLTTLGLFVLSIGLALALPLTRVPRSLFPANG